MKLFTWLVRDYILNSPRPSLDELFTLFFANLEDSIPSVRQGAAGAVANVVKAYGKWVLILTAKQRSDMHWATISVGHGSVQRASRIVGIPWWNFSISDLHTVSIQKLDYPNSKASPLLPSPVFTVIHRRRVVVENGVGRGSSSSEWHQVDMRRTWVCVFYLAVTACKPAPNWPISKMHLTHECDMWQWKFFILLPCRVFAAFLNFQWG